MRSRLSLAFLLALPCAAKADSFTLDEFPGLPLTEQEWADLNEFALTNDAHRSPDGGIRIGSPYYVTGGSWGSVYYWDEVYLQNGFSTTMQVCFAGFGGIHDADGKFGGDWLQFELGNENNGLTVEFDTFRSDWSTLTGTTEGNDPDSQHIGIHSFPSGIDWRFSLETYSIGRYSLVNDWVEGHVYTATIGYVPTSADWGTLNVDFEGLRILSVPLRITDYTTAGKTWVGVSGYTGDAYQIQDLRSWTFESADAPELSPCESWRQQNFGSSANSGNGADDADPDHDGRVNLLEYALGFNPNAPDSHLAASWTGNGADTFLTMTVTRPTGRTDVTVAGEVADSPAGPWLGGPSIVGFTAIDNGNGTETVTIWDRTPLAAGLPQHFLRIKATP